MTVGSGRMGGWFTMVVRVNQLDRGLDRSLIAVHRWLRKNGRVVHHSGRVNQLDRCLDRCLDRGLIAVHRWLRRNGRVVHHSGCITSWNRGLDRGLDRCLIAVQL